MSGVKSGQYEAVGIGKRGYPVVEFNKTIGIDGNTGKSVTRGQIHFGEKSGAHIVPDIRN